MKQVLDKNKGMISVSTILIIGVLMLVLAPMIYVLGDAVRIGAESVDNPLVSAVLFLFPALVIFVSFIGTIAKEEQVNIEEKRRKRRRLMRT